MFLLSTQMKGLSTLYSKAQAFYIKNKLNLEF